MGRGWMASWHGTRVAVARGRPVVRQLVGWLVWWRCRWRRSRPRCGVSASYRWWQHRLWVINAGLIGLWIFQVDTDVKMSAKLGANGRRELLPITSIANLSAAIQGVPEIGNLRHDNILQSQPLHIKHPAITPERV